MFDLKALDKEKHLRLTGVDNTLILQNMAYASDRKLLYEIRTVVVRGFTDSEEEIRGIAGLIKSLNADSYFRLIPFRSLGVRTCLAKTEDLDEKTFKHFCQIASNILGERLNFRL
ncbi:hypothetical protein SY88_09060 [Clostridiales bacterium PH28_bin88]|nr:hypothetical protein SY88_09060 [Clostridiales bacterium PH28_bin88]